MVNYYWKTIILALLLTIALTDCNAGGDEHQENFEDDTEKRQANKVNSVLATDEKGDELAYETPKYDMAKFHFVDSFDDLKKSQMKWIRSEAKKDDIADEIAKYDGKWEWEAPQRIIWKDDIGLVMKSKAKHAAISSLLRKPFTFNEEKPLVVQYEVTMQNGQECGGAYIKLLSANSKGNPSDYLKKFNDKTPYTIMFGPDKCGNDNKLHFIFRHVNPINGTISEKHCRKPKDRLEELFKDKEPHLYHLLIKPNNQFEIRIDHKLINYGSLLEDFEPPVNPPREIDDPNDKKPEDWDEREKIPDPTAKKPEDWDEDAPAQIPDTTAVIPDGWLLDEPEMIPDPSAIKPTDWDTEMDGEWEAPMIDNPVCEKAPGCGKWEPPMIANKEYKGKWYAPLIDNPNYKGKWKPRKIQNPDFFEDLTPFKMTPIGSVGIEIWSMSDDLLFDNLIITDDVKAAQDFAAQTFDIKRRFIEKQSQTLWHRLMLYINYKPGWWALYILYLLLPASAYIIYLSKRFKEATVTDKFTGIFKEYPILWITIIALTLLISFFFFKACTRKDVKNDTKKTDEPVPDSDEATVAAAGGDAGGGGDNQIDKVANASPKSKKTELDVSDDKVNDIQKMTSDYVDLETTDDSLDYFAMRDPKQKHLRQRHANTAEEEKEQS